MAWAVLLISAVLEAVWATALGQSEGFTRAIPTAIFLVATILSLLGLGWAAKHIPMGTAYSIWTGLGAALTVSYAWLTGAESASVWKLVFICGIVASIVGLKLLPSGAPPQPRVNVVRGHRRSEPT